MRDNLIPFLPILITFLTWIAYALYYGVIGVVVAWSLLAWFTMLALACLALWRK